MCSYGCVGRCVARCLCKHEVTAGDVFVTLRGHQAVSAAPASYENVSEAPSRELPDMMSASEGVDGKADILREVALIL